jgi:hypothetical protein
MVPSLGKFLILLGLVLTFLGLLATFLPLGKVGRLPGDITISFKDGRIYLPFATCLLISAIVSLFLWLIAYFRRWLG